MLRYPPGTVVAARFPFFRHFGIASDRFISGEQAVLSCSRRRGSMVEESFSEFAGGMPVESCGYWGSLHWVQVLARARCRLGQKWSLFGFNCEHAAYDAHGLPMQSKQIQAGVGLLGAAVTLLSVLRSA